MGCQATLEATMMHIGTGKSMEVGISGADMSCLAHTAKVLLKLEPNCDVTQAI